MKLDRGLDTFARRGRLFAVVMLVLMGGLAGRLVKLQLFDASVYSGESRTNAVRELRVLPARGTIWDRNGRLIVDNEPTYTVQVSPRYFDPDRTELLADLLAISTEELDERMQAARAWSPFRPSVIARGLTFDQMARVLEHRESLPGITYEAAQKRRYPTHVHASHVLGYVREISSRDLEQRRSDGYRPGDVIGIAGIERVYEDPLRGQEGGAFRLVNVHGQDVEAFRGGSEDAAPVGGRNVHVTLDLDLQAFAESLFVGKRGSVVALEPATGEILSLVSMPDYDLDMLSRPMKPETWQWFVAGRDKPQFNRATQSQLNPGSTWKPLMALIALQEGVITPQTRIQCNGGHPLGRGRFFTCMHRHGSITVSTAVRESCNTFFFEMMRLVNVNAHARYSRAFGFGALTALDLTEQEAGLIPDSAYFNRTYPEGWTVGYQMNLGVGQGNMGVTPIQLARYTAALASGGLLQNPHVVRSITDNDTGQDLTMAVEAGRRMPIDDAYMNLVRDAMRDVMEQGTGKWLQIPGIPSAGKTGTAQNPRGRDDSVFIMFAPFDDPQIALAVLVENAGFGATAAGPIASLMAERYLTGSISPRRRYLVSNMLALESDPLPE